MSEQLAWAAGLFEGEGCITVQPDRPHQIRLQLASTDRDVVERFAQIIGIGSVSLSQRKPNSIAANPKPLWFWVSVSGSAADVLQSLLPYLGERRAARAREVMAIRSNHIKFATRERLCDYCGHAFRPAWSQAALKARFCSEKHQREAANARARARRVHPPRICQVCDTTFTPTRSDRIYCSKRCRDRMGKLNQKRKICQLR